MLSFQNKIQPNTSSLSFADKVQPVTPIVTQRDTSLDNVNADKATFPTTGKEGILGGVGATLGNMPSSAWNFGKSLIQFFNPVNTVKTAQNIGESIYGAEQEGVKATDVLKQIPEEAYKAIVPQFLQHLFTGDTEKARATIQNDPVGQIAPILLMAKGAAEKAGIGAEFDSAVSKIASPVTKTASKAGSGVGNFGAQVLGAGTGAGASTIKTALGGSKAFTEAMRGNINPDEVVKNVENAVSAVKDSRNTAYLEALKKVVLS